MAGSYTTEDENGGGMSTGNIHEIEDAVMAEANGNGHDEDDLVTPSSSSGYIRSPLSDSMPELVRSQAHVKNIGLTLTSL